jgi:DNA-directed RNA polymerase specialized sigma24 family protein
MQNHMAMLVVEMTDDINKPQRADEVSSQTRLSIREAELYILHVELERSLNETAEMMDVQYGTVASTWSRVKDKIREADRTSELQIP